ncbi:MAG: hypothetical protein ABJK83_09115, partial [Parasphingorhabdus sp.]|uniref:hypothetical protein n=1 Tax=Parasphingorhabdus sp. TaxID=2709688 RepID=UPI0032975725
MITVLLWQDSQPPVLQLLQSGQTQSPLSKTLSSAPVGLKLHALLAQLVAAPCHSRLSLTTLLSASFSLPGTKTNNVSIYPMIVAGTGTKRQPSNHLQ